jgi:hypothetical protein
MCDHCSKWRSLPPGFRLQDSADAPWFCVLHPDPCLASCLVPEEPHGGNQAGSKAAASLAYSMCAGFIPWQAAAAAAAAAAGSAAHAAAAPDADNVAHFKAVLRVAAATPETAHGLHAVLVWLAKQQPDRLLTGLKLPRELVEAAPGYGEASWCCCRRS